MRTNKHAEKKLKSVLGVRSKSDRYTDLSGTDLRFTHFRRIKLRNVNLAGCDLSFSDLRGVDFSYSSLKAANLSYCQLEDAIFDHADCTGVDFSGTDLSNASFNGALSERRDLGADTLSAQPLITVYMPTWNRETLAIRAIKSVLKQDYEHWELIIVDDFSSSYQALSSFIATLNDPRVIYIRNAFNSGACAVRNQAIRMARGYLITGLDDDDEWLPDRLSAFIAKQHKLQTHGFLYAEDYLCDNLSYSDIAELRVYPKPAFARTLFDKKNIIGNQVLTLTSRLQQTLFDESLTAAQDYDAFYRLVENYGAPFKLDVITQILYVNHGEVRITASGRKFSGYLNFYKKHKIKFDTSSKKYQLFTLYYIRNKKMGLRTLAALMTLRNLKRYLMAYTHFKNKKY